MASNGQSNGVSSSYTNYVAYRDPKALRQARIGHLNLETSTIQPLSFASGTPLSSLYQVIEIGESQIKPVGGEVALSSVELLAPIYGRDILAVGKNYGQCIQFILLICQFPDALYKIVYVAFNKASKTSELAINGVVLKTQLTLGYSRACKGI